MLYSMDFKKKQYLCSGKREKKSFQELTSSPILYIGNTKIKFMIIMSRTNETIEMLQYQLKRYKAMKKGAACQSLQFKLQKMMNQANA